MNSDEYQKIINDWKLEHKEEIESGKCKHVFLECLPRVGKFINWKNSIGYKIHFIFNYTYGDLYILNYNSKNQKITTKYKDIIYDIDSFNFTNGKIMFCIGIKYKTYRYKVNDIIECKNSKIKILECIRTDSNNRNKKGEKAYKYICLKCGYTGTIKESSLLQNCGCIQCGKYNIATATKSRVEKPFEYDIGDIINTISGNVEIIDRYIKKTNNNYSVKMYKYKCHNCGYIGKYRTDALGKHGCPVCNNKKVIRNFNDVSTTNPELIKYFVNEEDIYTHVKGSEKKVLMKCPECGYEKEMSVRTLYESGFGCPKCGDGFSYPNKIMFNLLFSMNIDFINEYSSVWSDNKRYDFYFKYNNEEYIIEMNGEQHYATGFSSLGGRTLEQEQENDVYKKELAIRNGIKEENYIVIDCRKSDIDWIKGNILKSRLNKIFNLSVIDWSGIDKMSQSSLVKEVCDYWNNKEENETTNDLSNKFKLDKKTIRIYLKKGNEFGWCNYDPKKESIKNYVNLAISNSKRVEIFKDGKSLGVFNSCSELSRKSVELFNIKLNGSAIGAVANGKYNQHKGFTFKYVDNTNK